MNAFKNVFSYAFKHKAYLVLTLVLVVIETSFELLIPFVMSSLIDVGVKNNDINYIYISGSIIGVCAVISLITGIAYSKVAAKTAAFFGEEIRLAQFKKIEDYSFSNIDHFETSSLVTRVINDSALMQNTLATCLRPLCRAPMMLILGIVLSFIINWELALIFIILTPILGLIMFLILKTVAPRFTLLQKALDNLNLVIEENLVAIRIIKAFVREPYQEEKFAKVNRDYTSIVEKTFRIVNLGTPFFQFIMYLATVLIMYFGADLMINSNVQAGAITGEFSYVMQTFNSLMMLSNVCISLARSLASCQRVNQVLEEKIDIVDGKNKDNVIQKGDIEFKNVSFSYSNNMDKCVISDMNFKINHGEILGIIGSTGSGKSTLVELMERLYDVNRGEILIDDKDIKDYSLVHLRDSIAIVLQKNALFSDSLIENLKWGNLNASEEEIDWAVKMSCVDEFLPQLKDGLQTNLGMNGNNVSGGQKQRICIARALLKHPKILILDDATSALDNATEERLWDNLKSIKDMTIIIISQKIVSFNNASRILVIKEGKLDGLDSKEELLKTNQTYQDYYNLQVRRAE